MTDEILKIEGLTKHFGGVRAVDEISFDVRAGEIFSIIGPNGAGKTTLFNSISGVSPPDKGKIIFGGNHIAGKKPSEIAVMGMARTFQNLELFDGMTCLENLLPGRHRHMKTGLWQSLNLWHRKGFAAREELEHRKKVEEILELLDLMPHRDKLVGDLPYGLKKWIELGRALAMEPRLLLLDEPAAGMNQEECRRLFTQIRKIRDTSGMTIMIIEHNLEMVMNLSDRLLALDFGKEITRGEPRDVASHPEVISAWMGS